LAKSAEVGLAVENIGKSSKILTSIAREAALKPNSLHHPTHPTGQNVEITVKSPHLIELKISKAYLRAEGWAGIGGAIMIAAACSCGPQVITALRAFF
jgi:hypothetical protein